MMKKSNTLPIGYRLHQYRIESVLGAGGFGITYMAMHDALRTWAAIKEYFPVEWSYRDENTVMPNTQGGMPTSEAGEDACYTWGLERFLSEAQILAQISHPGVVRVRDFFEANGTAYIVMDYEDGKPLSKVLQEEKTLPEPQVRRLVDDILPALEAVHALGYLHRDIKPANLYCRSDGRTILIDFGAARQALGRHSKSVTSVFSPGYSPIEQYLVDGRGYGPWTDIYALGTVLYHCVTGVGPIEAPARVLDDPLQPAEERAAGRYSPALLRMIDRAIAVRPEQRFQSIAQMSEALHAPVPVLDSPSDDADRTVMRESPLRLELQQAAASHLGLSEALQASSPASSTPPVATPASHNAAQAEPSGIEVQPPKQPQRLLLIVSLAVLAVLAGGGGLWFATRSPDTTQTSSSAPIPAPTEAPPVAAANKPPADPQPGTLFRDPVTSMEFIWVVPGCFTMGSPETESARTPNEKSHQVCLKGFWMGKSEVTNAQYRLFASDHNSGAYEGHSLNEPNQPVVRISWHDAVAYAEWLSNKTGLNYRLPTEAEWEYAARAGNTGSDDWGNNPAQACRYANIYDQTSREAKALNWENYPCKDGQVAAAPIAQYTANPFGLYDLLGNASEWTCSAYDADYAGGETRCADAKATGRRVLRGGSWFDSPNLIRFAYRFQSVPEYGKWRSDVGFRLVLEP